MRVGVNVADVIGVLVLVAVDVAVGVGVEGGIGTSQIVKKRLTFGYPFGVTRNKVEPSALNATPCGAGYTVPKGSSSEAVKNGEVSPRTNMFACQP